MEERDLTHLPVGVRPAVEMLRGAWDEIIQLKASRREWEELRQSLPGYGNLGFLLADWYRAYTLAGCRRLLDDGKHNASAVRALRIIQRHAPKLTLDVLCAGFVGDRYEEDFRRDIAEKLRAFAGGDALTSASVSRAIDALRVEHERVVQLAHETVAHRAIEPTFAGESITYADTDRLLEDVGAIVQWWVGLLDNVHLSMDPPRIGHTRAAATALRLFSWKDYVHAMMEARRQLGPSAPPEAYDAVERSARLEYVFDSPAPTAGG